MTTEDIIKAICLKLERLYPNRKRFVDDTPINADDSFYVRVSDYTTKRHTAGYLKRSLTINILYYVPEKKVALHYYSWLDAMGFDFLTIEVGDGRLNTKNMKMQKDDDIYSVMFDLEYLVKEQEVINFMQNLNVMENLKGGVAIE